MDAAQNVLLNQNLLANKLEVFQNALNVGMESKSITSSVTMKMIKMVKLLLHKCVFLQTVKEKP